MSQHQAGAGGPAPGEFASGQQLADAMEALRASEERLRAIVASEPHCVKIVTAEGVLADMNPAGVRMLEVNRLSEVISRNVRELVHPDDWQAYLRLHRAALAGETGELRLRIRTLRGKELWVETRAAPLRESDGTVRSVLSVTLDITAQREAQLRLEGSRRALLMLSRCNEAIARAAMEQALLAEICGVIRETGGYRSVAIAYAPDDERPDFAVRAHAGERIGTTLRVAWDEQGGSGVLCLPLTDEQRTFGALVIGLREPGGLPDYEQQVLRELGKDLSFGITSLRGREERRRMREAVQVIAGRVAGATGSEFFRTLTLGLVQALGAQAGFIGRYVEWPARRARTLAAVIGGEVLPDFECDLAWVPCAQPDAPATWSIRRGLNRSQPPWYPVAPVDAESCVGAKLVTASGERIGVAIVLFAQPLVQHETVASVLELFAARAASEFERMQAEAKLRQQASLLDQAPDAILVRDLHDNRVTYWNKGAERLFGWTAREALGRNARELVPGGQEEVERAMAALMQTGEWTGEFGSVDRHGRELLLERRWRLVRDAEGRPTAVLSILTDVTERKRAQAELQRLNAELEHRVRSRTAQLEAANRELEAFSYTVSHDLRAPLGAISGFAGVLEHAGRDWLQGQAAHALRRIKASARHMEDIIDGLLTLAQLPREPLALQRVDLSALARDVVAELRAAQPREGVQVHVEPGVEAMGDPRMLRQLLANLLGNAWKFTSGRPRACIAFGREHASGAVPVYFVRDDGPGFEMAYVDKLFSAFQRLHTAAEFPGTGIGLATVQRIVQRHGGRVWAESRPGEGAAFRFTLQGG